MKKEISTLFFVFASLILAMTFANAVQDFTVSPTSLTDNVVVGDSSSKTFTIENTGDESINLTLSDNDLSKSGETDVSVTLNQTTITNLAAGSSVSVRASYSPNSVQAAGVYTSSIIVRNTQNSSQIETISLSVTLTEEDTNEYDVAFEDQGSSLEIEIDVDDDSESKTFKLKNTGTKRIDDIEIDLDRLDGDDDEIDNDDIEINGEPGDETYEFDEDEGSDFHLMPGETVNVKFRIDIPSNLDVDDYRGDLEVSYLVEGDSSRSSRTFVLKAIATSDDDDIFIDDNIYVRSGILEVSGEAGDILDDLEITIANDASYDVEDITLKLDGDLEEEESSDKIDSDYVTFKGLPVDIDDRSDEDIDLEIEIPEGQPTGTYIAKIELYNAQDKKKDTITLKVKVTGDVYFKEIDFPSEVEPGDNMDVKFTVKNQGSKSLNNVQIYATLFDIDYGYSDITENTNSFILNTGDEKELSLRFNIPDEASDGSHTLQLRITYDGEEITETEEVIVNRPSNNVVVDSFGINPKVAKCDREVYTFMKFKNLGKYDENVQVTVSIEGTNVQETSSNYELDVDGENTESINLDISGLEAGDYKVIQKLNAGGKVTTKTSSLQILKCSDSSVGGIDINDTSINQSTNDTENTKKTIEIFGQEIETTTAWLGGGVGVVFLAIIVVAIFLL